MLAIIREHLGRLRLGRSQASVHRVPKARLLSQRRDEVRVEIESNRHQVRGQSLSRQSKSRRRLVLVKRKSKDRKRNRKTTNKFPPHD